MQIKIQGTLLKGFATASASTYALNADIGVFQLELAESAAVDALVDKMVVVTGEEVASLPFGMIFRVDSIAKA